MHGYNTQQRQLLLEYFSRHVDESVSTAEVIEGLRGRPISTSAIYRNLSLLEQEGKLRRTSKADERDERHSHTLHLSNSDERIGMDGGVY